MNKKLLLIFPLIMLAVPPFFRGLTTELPLYVFFAVAFAGLALVMIPLAADKKSITINSVLDFVLPAFIIVYLVSIIAAASRYYAVTEVLKYLSFLALYLVIRYTAADKKNASLLINAVAASAVVAAICAIAAAIKKTNLPVATVLQDHNVFGLFCALGIVICFSYGTDSESRLLKLIYFVASGILMFGIMLSCSISSVVLLVTAIVLLCVVKKGGSFKAFTASMLMFAAVAAVAAVVLAASPDIRSFWLSNPFATSEFTEKIAFWSDGYNAVKTSWLIGHGGGGWSIVYPTFQSFTYSTHHARSFIMQMWVECGLLGMFVLIAFIYMLLKAFRSAIKSNPLICVVIGMILVHSFVDMTFQVAAMSVIFWGLLAVLACAGSDSGPDIKIRSGKLVVFALVCFVFSGMMLLNYNSKTVAQKYLDKQSYQKAAQMYKQAMIFNYYDDISRLNYMYSYSMYLGTAKGIPSSMVYEYARVFNNKLANVVSANKKNIATLKLCQDLYRQTYNTDLAITIAEYIVDIDPLDPVSYEILAGAYVNKIIVLSQSDNPDINMIKKLYSYIITIPDVIVKNTANKKETVEPTKATLSMIGASVQELSKLE